MDRNYGKFFDVARPDQMNSSATSRPVIVGHRPMMVDPMVRGAKTPQSSSGQAAAPVHKAKIIEVSDEVKNEIAVAEKAPEPLAPSSPPAPVSADLTGIGEIPTAASAPDPAAESPALEASAPAADTVQSPAPTAAAETLVPTPDLSHIPHVPVSHQPAYKGGKLKNLLIWTGVALILTGFGAYLAIDAGLVGSSVQLPFHIFSLQV
jgi:uncharacterized membrane protein